jgi:hypothetical protein
MVQRREGLCLTVESRQTFRIGRECLWQYLDGDLAAKVGISRPIHLAHSAHADLGTDLIRADATAWGERQAGTDVIIRKREVPVRLSLQHVD